MAEFNRERKSSGPKKSGERGGGRGFYKTARKKQCRFCTDGMVVDYKNVGMIRTFMSERAKIVPRRNTGTCAKHQRQLTTAIKRARILALVPFTTD